LLSLCGDQVIARVMENRDGSAYVETWRKGAGWIKGGATFGDFFEQRQVPEWLAKRQGLPLDG
jgi:hypothetical protein